MKLTGGPPFSFSQPRAPRFIKSDRAAMRSFTIKKCKRLHGLRFSPKGDRLLVVGGFEAGGPDNVTCVDSATGEALWAQPFCVDSYAFSMDGTLLVAGTSAFSRSDLANLVRWSNPWEDSFEWHPVKVTFGWPARTVVVASVIVAINGANNRLLAAFGRQRFQPGGGSVDWTHQVADCALDGRTPALLTNLDTQALSIAISPDETRWATSIGTDVRPAIRLHDSPEGPPLAQYHKPGSKNPAARLTFSPDGRYLAAMSGRTIPLLSGDRLELVAVLTGHSKELKAISFSPDSRRLLSASYDGAIRIWDTATGKSAAEFNWKIGPLTAIAVAPDGLTCAAGGMKGQVVIWDVDE